MNDEQIDYYLADVLRAAGSNLKHYSMHKTRTDMRDAMRNFMNEIVASCAEIADANSTCEGIGQKIRDEILAAFTLPKAG